MRNQLPRFCCLVGLVVLSLSIRGRADENEDYHSSLPEYEPTVLNGDWDGDGRRTVADVVNMFRWLYTGNAAPAVPAACELAGSHSGPASPEVDQDSDIRYLPSTRNGDINGNWRVNVTDAVLLIEYLFLGGDEPQPIECEAHEK